MLSWNVAACFLWRSTQDRQQQPVRTRGRRSAGARCRLQCARRRRMQWRAATRFRARGIDARCHRRPRGHRHRQFLFDANARLGCVLRGLCVSRDLGGEPDRLLQLFARARFRQIAEYLTFIDRRLDRLQVGISGQQNAHRVRRQGLDGFEHFDAGHARHPLVRHDDVHRVIAQQINRFLSAVRQQHFVVATEHRAHRRQHAAFVIDEQQRAALQHSGFHLRQPPRRRPCPIPARPQRRSRRDRSGG